MLNPDQLSCRRGLQSLPVLPVCVSLLCLGSHHRYHSLLCCWMLAERQQWIHCSVICVLSHLRQKAIVLLRCHVSLRLARRSPAGSISRCRHSVDCGGARLNGYAKEVLVSQSSEKYLVIELGVVMFTLQNNVTFPVCIAPTHRQHCHASAGSSFLTWCLFFFSYLTASWLLLAPTVPGVQPKAPRWQSAMKPEPF